MTEQIAREEPTGRMRLLQDWPPGGAERLQQEWSVWPVVDGVHMRNRLEWRDVPVVEGEPAEDRLKPLKTISAADIFMAEPTTTDEVRIAERMMSKRILDAIAGAIEASTPHAERYAEDVARTALIALRDATRSIRTAEEITRILGDGDDQT